MASFWRNHEASLPPAGHDLLLQSSFQIIWAFFITKEYNTTWSNPTCGLLKLPKLSWITEAWTSQQFSFPQAFHVYSSFLMTTDDKSRAIFLSLWYRVQIQFRLLSLEQLCAKNLVVSAPNPPSGLHSSASSFLATPHTHWWTHHVPVMEDPSGAEPPEPPGKPPFR